MEKDKAAAAAQTGGTGRQKLFKNEGKDQDVSILRYVTQIKKWNKCISLPYNFKFVKLLEDVGAVNLFFYV